MSDRTFRGDPVQPGTIRLRTVGEVSELTGVTARTLHHYDQIGVLTPSERSDAGYRLYSDADLLRLHTIMNWREMGFGLADIAAMLDAPDQALSTGLDRQRMRLVDQADRLNAMIAAIDCAISTLEEGRAMTDDELTRLFEGFEPARYEDEVLDRWGDTSSYAVTRGRTHTYTEEDWKRQRQESESNVATFVELLGSGAPATDGRAVEAAREHGAMIDRWFYPLAPDAHVGLARMYTTDPRFESVYEEVAVGLAQYIADAIEALHSS